MDNQQNCSSQLRKAEKLSAPLPAIYKNEAMKKKNESENLRGTISK